MSRESNSSPKSSKNKYNDFNKSTKCFKENVLLFGQLLTRPNQNEALQFSFLNNKKNDIMDI